LRPMFRGARDLELGSDGSRLAGRSVPLRAWYPIEVLRFPLRDRAQAAARLGATNTCLRPPRTRFEQRYADSVSSGDSEVLAQAFEPDRRELTDGLARGALVVDERLRDLLARGVPASDAPEVAPSFVAPDVVSDAEYAAECAEVGEVDLDGLERQIHELQRRLAALEHPLGQRVKRRVVRLLRR
jgi:hypothetical protein